MSCPQQQQESSRCLSDGGRALRQQGHISLFSIHKRRHLGWYLWLQGVAMILIQLMAAVCAGGCGCGCWADYSRSTSSFYSRSSSSPPCYFNFKVQMGQTSSNTQSPTDMRWKQLKQSGINSLGIMNRDPKQFCMMMKTNIAAFVMMKIPRALQSLGQRVSWGDANLQQKQGMRMKSRVNTKTTESPPRPPVEQEQLICSAIKQKDQKIQKVSDSSKKQHKRKYPNNADIEASLSQVSLNDFSTSSQFLKKKNAKQILMNAQRPTNFKLVSIFSKETLMKSQLTTIVKPNA